MSDLVLASTSAYRRRLLERLKLEFRAVDPGIDETPLPGERPAALAARLAAAKAGCPAAGGDLIIGSDQVAELDGAPLGKPGSHAAALAGLMACQGRTVVFHTAVAVFEPAARRWHRHVDRTRVRFARLPEAALERYLALEPAYDCAGGFKVEGLGVALFERVESEDPTALVGLPLIWLARTLRECGLDPLDPAAR